MYSISIRYFNILAAYAEKKTETVDVPPGTTVLELINQLGDNKPKMFREVVLQDGEVSHHLRIFRNERSLDGETLDIALEDGDKLMLFPAVSGG
jgi:MoaD family protein